MSDKKGKGSGTKDACYHKVKARYSVWPSAYASGALVKCRKKGAANWGNKSESFEIDPKKHKDAQKKQKMRNLAIGNENPNEKKVAEKKAGGPKLVGEGKYSKSETYVKGTAPVRATYGGKTESFPKETYKKGTAPVRATYGGKTESFPKETYKKKTTKTEELNIDLAVDYFFTEGINEDGLEMIIEETGLEKFVEFVEYLTDIEVLTEARAARKARKRRKDAKSYEQIKAEIDAKEKAKAAKRAISVDKTKKATATAKTKQPEKKPVRDAIARGVFRAVDAYKKGMERHNAAMATAKKAGKVAGKAAGEFAKGAGEGVKTAGKVAKVAYKVATKEEVELEEKKKSGDPCWVGYKQVGMKKKGAKMVPNCVPEETEVEEGYRVVSTSYKSGDGNPKDDATIKRQKKVVSGDNLTKKGAERSANARRQEYGTGDAFQVQKTRTAKKRPSNAASEAEVKAKIDAKEKKQQKSRAQQSIAGMNRAGTPSGKVAAARLKTDKKFNMEGYKPIDKKKENEMYRRAGNLARTSLSSTGAKKKESASKSAKIVSAISRQKENERFDKMADIKARDNYTEEVVQSILEKCWAGYEKKGMKTMFGKRYPNCVKKKATRKEEVEVDEKYQGMYQSPAPTYNRLKSNDEKARMSPGRRAMAKSDELEKSEPGSKRAKAQKKASMQMSATSSLPVQPRKRLK